METSHGSMDAQPMVSNTEPVVAPDWSHDTTLCHMTHQLTPVEPTLLHYMTLLSHHVTPLFTPCDTIITPCDTVITPCDTIINTVSKVIISVHVSISWASHCFNWCICARITHTFVWSIMYEYINLTYSFSFGCVYYSVQMRERPYCYHTVMYYAMTPQSWTVWRCVTPCDTTWHCHTATTFLQWEVREVKKVYRTDHTSPNGAVDTRIITTAYSKKSKMKTDPLPILDRPLNCCYIVHCLWYTCTSGVIVHGYHRLAPLTCQTSHRCAGDCASVKTTSLLGGNLRQLSQQKPAKGSNHNNFS